MLKPEIKAKRATAARWAGTFLRVFVLRERLCPQAGDLEGDFHDTAWVEGVEAIEGISIPVVRQCPRWYR
jgi:hypothetical protein